MPGSGPLQPFRAVRPTQCPKGALLLGNPDTGPNVIPEGSMAYPGGWNVSVSRAVSVLIGACRSPAAYCVPRSRFASVCSPTESGTASFALARRTPTASAFDGRRDHDLSGCATHVCKRCVRRPSSPGWRIDAINRIPAPTLGPAVLHSLIVVVLVFVSLFVFVPLAVHAVAYW